MSLAIRGLPLMFVGCGARMPLQMEARGLQEQGPVDPFCLSARTQYPEGPPRACLDSAHRSKLCPRPPLNAPPCLPPGSSSPQAGVEHVLEVTLGHLGRGFWASGTRALEGATSSGCAHFLGTPFREEGGGQRKVGAAPLKHRDPGGDPSILSL